jgi:hypothetical protein
VKEEETSRSLDNRTAAFSAQLATRASALSKLMRAHRRSRNHDGYDPEAVARWLETAREVTANWADLETIRVGLLESWHRALSLSLLQLESELRQSCGAKGWRLDGQWPEFVVEYGISVHVDEKERVAIVGSVRCPANTTAITRVLQGQVDALIPKNFSAQRFMGALLRAYQAASESRRGQAPVLDVYRSFVIQSQSPKFWRDAKSELFTPVSTDQFRARLSTTLEKGVTRADGHELRLLPPLDPKDALFVYQPAERRFGYVGRIEFVQAQGMAHDPRSRPEACSRSDS